MNETFALSDLLRTLIELEQAGQRLYGSLATAHAGDPQLQAVFAELAGWERRHEELYAAFLGRLDPATGDTLPDDPEYLGYLRALVQSGTHILDLGRQPVQAPEEALRMALQLEKETVLFLGEVIPHLPATFAAAGIMKEILAEERRHVSIIQGLLEEGRGAPRGARV